MCFNRSGADAAAVTAQLIFHYGGDADTDANDANAGDDKDGDDNDGIRGEVPGAGAATAAMVMVDIFVLCDIIGRIVLESRSSAQHSQTSLDRSKDE